MQIKTRARWSLVALLVAAGGASAQSADALRSAVEKAVSTNPEVAARFNAYRASIDAVDVARAAYLPRVDLSADLGREVDAFNNRSPDTQTLNRNAVGLSLSQLLWDGMGTRHDVARSGHDRLARYFELLDVTEQTSLEATSTCSATAAS
jgi:outer membrane protein, adhesin transport system